MVLKYQVDLMNSIGFVWTLQDHVLWIEIYQELIVYKIRTNLPLFLEIKNPIQSEMGQ